MFEKILLPTDGSRHSADAARVAGELAARLGGTVTPLVAVEFEHIHADDLGEEVAETIRRRIRSRAESAIESTAAVVRERGGVAEPGRIVEGPPAQAILTAAEDGEYDLIVMGSRGLSLDLGRSHPMGSVTERVLHRAPCPVLVVRAE